MCSGCTLARPETAVCPGQMWSDVHQMQPGAALPAEVQVPLDAAIEVPNRFDAVALATARAAADSDPRNAEAVAHAEHGCIAQFLAGIPALIQRYRSAPPTTRAVVDAAVDARRLGAGPGLPYALLAASAPGYLTDQQWDAAGEDWLEQALAYTGEPCRGLSGPLTLIRPR